MKGIGFFLLFILFGCSTNSGVVPIDESTFKIFKQAGTGFTGSDAVKSDVLVQASQFCATKKKTIKVTNVILGEPPYILGNFPKAEVQFQCVDSKLPATADDDTLRKLRELKELLDNGTLTQKEFDQQKKKILEKDH